jgi:hypothetical protein
LCFTALLHGSVAHAGQDTGPPGGDLHKAQALPLRHTEAMKQRIDSPQGRVLYGRRFAIVEPVFGNLRHNKGLNRFTLRGRIKVDVQRKLFCLVYNIEKLAHHGYAQ